MSQRFSRELKLFGTDAPAPVFRRLQAGPLSVELCDGNLRYLRVGGVEALRGIAFVVRDAFWGTYNPKLSNLVVEEDGDTFNVSYDAICEDASQAISYRANISGHADGGLSFAAELEPKSDFSTNRVGFVVLHPLAGVAGSAAEIEHVDGSVERSKFPDLVEPWQPFMDIRSMTHEVMPGVKVTCEMLGDTFETEDHRNWTDASYKTYVRPLAAPAPFVMPAGELSQQSVNLTLTGVASSVRSAPPTTLSLGEVSGRMPRIGLGVHPRRAERALAHASLVKTLGPQLLVCHFDERDGHSVADLQSYKSLQEATGAELNLELVVPCERGYIAELDTAAEYVTKSGATFASVTVVPGPDLLAGRPFSDFPDVPPLGELYDAARARFSGSLIGGGSCSYFTELNRRRPPMQHLDYLTHVTCAIVHAADDVSITETLEAWPYMLKSAAQISEGKPYRIGPSAIGSRHAPFGGAVTPNPDNTRVTMTRHDSRQRALLGAAYYLGICARAAGHVDALSLASPLGEFGLIYDKMDWSQPGYDNGDAAVYPAFPVIAGMAGAASTECVAVNCSSPSDIQAVANRDPNGRTLLWVANLRGSTHPVVLEGLAAVDATICLMDEDSFEQCVAGPGGFAATERKLENQALELGPYAVARIAIA